MPKPTPLTVLTTLRNVPSDEFQEQEESYRAAVRSLLRMVGENPERGGLLETPERVVRSMRFLCSGYNQKPEDVLKSFEDGAESYDEMVVQRNIPVASLCEHHLLPFFGTALIAYVPNGKVVGLSKLKRLVDVFARRLQVQERLTAQIADALTNGLNPRGVGVVLECRHMCMELRGVCTPETPTITSALRGVLLDKPEARAEFLALRG